MKPVSALVVPRNIAGSLNARLADVHHAIVSCERCPRLRTYCRTIAREKKRAYLTDTYWGRPVPGFGDPDARLLVVGLAPAAHGANRTGRVFTGDGIGGSGDFLMSALHRTGFASIPTSRQIDDGLTLKDAYIVMPVRCAPPDNKPLPEEIARCLDHLEAEVNEITRARVVVALGKIAVLIAPPPRAERATSRTRLERWAKPNRSLLPTARGPAPRPRRAAVRVRAARGWRLARARRASCPAAPRRPA
jgi:uracil-DNA glycosylase family 4